ncbi:MAG TPA: dTDP-4-dehydrorhamnose reductase [Blastocatellia bacterium]|nr:dTDP-4-dehydrorhamnose reductase [Blastocatellia bacterium]
MRPILLLGKDGQVGWELQRSLAPLGPLVMLGRQQCDLADLVQLRDIVRNTKPRLIVNAAAYTAVDRAEQEPDLALRVNSGAPGVLAEEARALDIPLIHYSSDYVFDGEKATPYVEDDKPNPLSVYGRTKLEGESAITAAGGRALIFRSSWVFGETGTNFVRTILRLAAERDTLRVVDDQIGAPTPAALIADVTAHVIVCLDRESWPAEAQIFHLAAAGPVSWHTYACTIVDKARELGMQLKLSSGAIQKISTDEYPLPAKRPRNSRLDCTRLMQRFSLVLPDWRPYLERMLRRTKTDFRH